MPKDLLSPEEALLLRIDYATYSRKVVARAEGRVERCTDALRWEMWSAARLVPGSSGPAPLSLAILSGTVEYHSATSDAPAGWQLTPTGAHIVEALLQRAHEGET